MVGIDGLQRHSAQRDHALLASFAPHSHQSFAPADIIVIHPDQLTDSSARRVERFQYGAIAQDIPSWPPRKLHQRAGIVLGENAGEVFG